MRVCMFAMTLPVHATGGMEIHALDLARGIAEAGHEVSIITSRHPRGVECEKSDGLEIHYADVKPTSRLPLGKKSMLLLQRLQREKGFDVIHSQSGAASRYVTDGLKERLRVPLVMTMHGTSRGEVRSILNQGLKPMTLPRILFRHYIDRRYTRLMVGGCDAVIAISRELTEEIPQEFGINPRKVRTIHNGIDVNRFRPGKSRLSGRFGGKRVILSVSVLQGQKGVQYLLKALGEIIKEVPNAHLIVVGDGPYRKELQEMAARMGIDSAVTFEGRIQNDELPDYYNAADVFVIPTVRVEGLPLIELEAMACGKPVVASDIGGIPTVIKDGENGILVKPGNSSELADGILRVLGDGSLASMLGGEARKTIEGGFSRQKMVRDTIAVYEYVRWKG